MSPKITFNGKDYEDFGDLPPEAQAKIREKLGKLGNNPMAKNLLKMYGVDMNKLESGSFGGGLGGSSGGGSFNNGPDTPFGSSTDPFAGQKGGGTGWWIFLIVLVCIGGVAALIFGINMITQSWEETFALKGDPARFDPVASVNEVRSHFDPNAKLSSIEISYLKSDGTMDLTATSYNAKTTYQFYRELAQPPKNAPPVGAGATISGKWYEPVEAEVYRPGQWNYVSKMGGGVSTEYSYSNKGIDLNRDDPTATPDTFVDDPKCSLADFWKTAEQKGAPADAVARITYDKDGYNFSISNTSVDLNFGPDCKLKTD